MQTWLWRQDVLLFARYSRKHGFEKVLEFKTQQVYFIYPFLRRLKVCQYFFAYSGKHLFAKQELIMRARLRGQDFATGKNFSFNQCHTKSFAFFLEAVGEFSTVMQTRDEITVSNSPNPSRVYIRLCKRFLLLK